MRRLRLRDVFSIYSEYEIKDKPEPTEKKKRQLNEIFEVASYGYTSSENKLNELK